jgi:hypothetical protein
LEFLPCQGLCWGHFGRVDSDFFEIVSWDIKNFSVSCVLKNKVDNKIWRHISIYGSPYEEGKEEFISQ